VKSKLKLGGVFHMATDWEAYAEHMLEVMSGLDGYKNQSQSNFSFFVIGVMLSPSLFCVA
jgi:tRNA G46 methylase TrmB